MVFGQKLWILELFDEKSSLSDQPFFTFIGTGPRLRSTGIENQLRFYILGVAPKLQNGH